MQRRQIFLTARAGALAALLAVSGVTAISVSTVAGGSQSASQTEALTTANELNAKLDPRPDNRMQTTNG